MRIDTHTHVLLTKTSSFEWEDVILHFDVARAHALDVVCLTEHLDAKEFNRLYSGIFIENRLRAQVIDDGIIQLPNGLIVASGTEVPLKGGGEVGLCTNMKLLNCLEKQNGYYDLESLLSFLYNSNTSYSLIGNHLCNPKKWIANIEKYKDSIDAIEILSKYRHLKDEYENLSKLLDKPLVSGSDSHTWVQFGLSYTDVEIEKFSILDFKKAIRNRDFKIYMDENTEKMIKVSELLRENLKSKINERKAA